MRAITLLKAVSLLSSAIIVAGCAPSSYAIRQPVPSGQKIQSSTPLPQAIAIQDLRATDQRLFNSGILNSTLNYGAAPIDPPRFLAENLEAELVSRGVPAKVTAGDDTLPRIDLLKFRMVNHRTNAYTPYITFTYLSADLQIGPEIRRVGVFVKRGKVPVWSFDEIVEPTLNEPMSIAVKELATKLLQGMGDSRSSDADVAALVAKLSTRSATSFLDVYALGFTNNPAAIDTLVKLVADPDEYVRLAAISSLGTLRATGQYPLLKSIAEKSDAIWQDRAMALKSIGDLGTAEGRTYLQERLKQYEAGKSDKEAQWSVQVISLYL